jgi:hypothetical protein
MPIPFSTSQRKHYHHYQCPGADNKQPFESQTSKLPRSTLPLSPYIQRHQQSRERHFPTRFIQPAQAFCISMTDFPSLFQVKYMAVVPPSHQRKISRRTTWTRRPGQHRLLQHLVHLPRRWPPNIHPPHPLAFSSKDKIAHGLDRHLRHFTWTGDTIRYFIFKSIRPLYINQPRAWTLLEPINEWFLACCD